MAGIGDAWGTREELLHPRDKHGRFRSSWKMPEGVVDKISGFLSSFRPRTFQSDQQASQYTQNLAGKKRFSLAELARVHADYNAAQEDLRDGHIDDPSTKKFTDMMDRHAIELPDDVIVSRVLGPDAFGLTPETMNAEEGGIQDFTGKKIADRAYSAVNLGTPLAAGPGQITMSIAVPKGTKATLPGLGGNDRSMYLQREQQYRVTKVTPDGRGGYYVLAVAEEVGSGTPEPIGGHVGAGRPRNREAAVREVQLGQARTMRAEGDQPLPAPDNNPATPQAALPDGTQPRTEPHVAESVGGGPATPAGPAPATPETNVPAPSAEPATPQVDADVARIQGRARARNRQKEIARAVPVGMAVTELAELDAKKADDKVIAQHIEAILGNPIMDEVPKESVGIRAGLTDVAKDFREGKPRVARARLTRLAKSQGITTDHKAGSVVDFDESTMDSVGDIPEDGKVEVIRPGITMESSTSGEKIVLERAQVTGALSKKKPAKSTKKPAKLSDDEVLARAQKLSGPPKNDEERKLATPAITDKTTVADLKKIAADRGIDVKGLRLKKDIRERIEGGGAPKPKTQRELVAEHRAANIRGRAKAAETMVGKDLGSVEAVARAVAGKQGEGEKAPDLDSMTKAQLLEHARQGDMMRTIKQSMTKDQIKAEIRKAGKAAPVEAGSQADKDAQIAELLGKKPTVADLKKYAQDNNIEVKKARPLKADLIDAILESKGSPPKKADGGQRPPSAVVPEAQKYARRQDEVARIAASSSEPGLKRLGGGSDAKLATYPNGQKLVIKNQSKRDNDGDTLGALVGNALGLHTPAIHRDGDRVYMDYIPGTIGGDSELWTERGNRKKLFSSRDGVLMGLLDVLTVNGDRNSGNWIVRSDGSLAAIDHGFAFEAKDTGMAFASPFARQFFDSDGKLKTNDISPKDLATIRERLMTLRPDFERLGRGDWFDAMLQRLAEVEGHATGTKSRL